MKILVTGAKGFVGKNLCESLKNIRDGKDRREKYLSLLSLSIYEYDIDSSEEDLDKYCSDCDFVFNLAGVNRPKDENEFMKGNFGFASRLLDCLKKHNNTCPVMLSSSIQASLEGRYAESDYGKSKLAGEQLFKDYHDKTGAEVLIYRFPNLFGKWCRPNYNSVVATFCNNIANGLPIQVNDPAAELDLLYIDDLVEQLLLALVGRQTVQDDGFIWSGKSHRVTLGQIVDLLNEFRDSRDNLFVPNVSEDSFSKKLLSTYLTYIPSDKFSYKLDMHEDVRGSFTEMFKSSDRGQVSINISKPGITKGQHWHHSKWEKFVVVSGKGLIQLRRVGEDENGNEYPVVDYYVSGDEIEVVEMIPGYTHNIINLSDTQDLVTVMWCNECFDRDKPDTFGLEV